VAEPTEFTVKLTAFSDTAKVKLIKEIKSLIPGMNLVQVNIVKLASIICFALHY
jgi:ribosomal protein L7/L12